MAGYGSGNAGRIAGKRQEIREILTEISAKRKAGKDTAYLRSELSKVRGDLARLERDESKEIKAAAHPRSKRGKPSWWH